MVENPERATVQAHGALGHGAFRLFLASSLLASLGAEMLATAVAWQIYAITHRAIDLGYVGLIQFAPALTLSLPAGSLADRVDRGRIVAFCLLGLAACSLALLVIAEGDGTTAAPIFLVLFFVGVARAFEGPAAQALVPGLVPSGHLSNALTWSATVWQVSTIAGPALGGALYAAGGPTWVFTAAAAMLTTASLLAFAIRSRAVASVVGGAAEAGWTRVLAGLRFVGMHPVVFGAISLDLFAVLLGGATTLLPIYARDILHVGPLGLGLLRSAPAAGATATAMALAYRPLTRRAGPIMLASVALFGAATVVFGVSRSFALSLASLAVLGGADMISVVVRGTVVQLGTPHEMRGRVSAVNMMFVSTSADLGGLESGLVAAWLGAAPAVILGGVGALLVVAVYALCAKSLRSVDRLDDAG